MLAMVTGASSGIGEAYADRLAADGWDVVLVARRRGRLEEIAARLESDHGVSARVAVADLGDPAQLSAVCVEAASLPLGLLVNNAALAHYRPFVELAPELAQELVQLNVLAPVLLTRAVLPGMVGRGAGSVVNVASLLAFSGAWVGGPQPQRAVYAASKSFLLTFTQILAGELAESGVVVQVVCPGVVRTEFHTRQGMDLSAVQRMEPQDVVTASLRDLERGVVISIPGTEDLSPLERIEAAEAELRESTLKVEIASRYRS